MKTLILRCLSLLLVIILAILWVLFDTRPLALAQESKVNHTYGQLEDRDFSHQDLVGSVFAAAIARGANFSESNMTSSILTKADFINANLSGTNLTNSLMDRVSFDGANLTNAILIDAVATSTTFYQANVTGADFSGAILDRYQTALLCKQASGVNPTTQVATRDSLGCR